MHIQSVPLGQVQLVNQEHLLGRNLPGYQTQMEERSQVDLNFGWRATNPSPPWSAVEPNTWNEARVDSSSAKSRPRTDCQPKDDSLNLASPRSSMTEDCGENNIENCLEDSDLLVSRAYFSQWMRRYSEIRADTAGFLVQMEVGTDTYKDFRATLRFPKRRVTPNKRINEAKVLMLELKIKEADVLVAEAELEAAEVQVRTEAARLHVVEQKKKMTAMGFEI
ncbi:hypothetical protein FRC04_004073 [Tulasnella sp. 424]|nr:hypothetical protein FRC04_004073 [Tulasnella sp. 424]KAG8964504.1 hypothetical protein FRC05_003785 [Tulasnella sp. 425]